MNSNYTNITNYKNNPDYEAKQEFVYSRFGSYYRTVYVKRGESDGSVAIPPRNTGSTLDMSKLAEVQAWADKMRKDLS